MGAALLVWDEIVEIWGGGAIEHSHCLSPHLAAQLVVLHFLHNGHCCMIMRWRILMLLANNYPDYETDSTIIWMRANQG